MEPPHAGPDLGAQRLFPPSRRDNADIRPAWSDLRRAARGGKSLTPVKWTPQCGVIGVAIIFAYERFVHDNLPLVVLLASSGVFVAAVAAYYELSIKVPAIWKGHIPGILLAVVPLIGCPAALTIVMYPLLYPAPPAPAPPPPPPPAKP